MKRTRALLCCGQERSRLPRQPGRTDANEQTDVGERVEEIEDSSDEESDLMKSRLLECEQPERASAREDTASSSEETS